jgi:hypothetical protein
VGSLCFVSGEEDHLNPVGRKYIPYTMQKKIVRDCWERTTPEKWRQLLPYMLISIPRHGQRYETIILSEYVPSFTHLALLVCVMCIASAS